MPSFSVPNVVNPFPAWADFDKRSRVSWWPHPSTPRVDARLRWPSDSLSRPIATRHYLKLWYGADVVTPQLFEWFWYDLEVVGPYHAIGETGTSDVGNSVGIDIQYHEALPSLGTPGVRVEQEIRVVGEPIVTRWTEYPESGAGFPYDQRYLLDIEGRAIQRSPNDDDNVGGQWPIKTAEWWPTSECWRWWDTGVSATCTRCDNPSGLPATRIRLDGFTWVNGNEIFGNFTEGQYRFQEVVNTDHLLQVVRIGSAFEPCLLGKIGETIIDPDATAIDLGVGAYYTWGIRLVVNPTFLGCQLSLRESRRVGPIIPMEPAQNNLLTDTWGPPSPIQHDGSRYRAPSFGPGPNWSHSSPILCDEFYASLPKVDTFFEDLVDPFAQGPLTEGSFVLLPPE